MGRAASWHSYRPLPEHSDFGVSLVGENSSLSQFFGERRTATPTTPTRGWDPTTAHAPRPSERRPPRGVPTGGACRAACGAARPRAHKLEGEAKNRVGPNVACSTISTFISFWFGGPPKSRERRRALTSALLEIIHFMFPEARRRKQDFAQNLQCCCRAGHDGSAAPPGGQLLAKPSV